MTTNPPPSQITSDSTWREQAIALARKVMTISEMLKTKGKDFKGKLAAVSGSGNVAQYAVEKVNQLGGKVVTLSDSKGYIYDPEGIDADKLAWVMDCLLYTSPSPRD